MKILAVYRGLLNLYPYSFRQQFADEMVEIFRQLTQDRAVMRGPIFASIIFHEFLGLLIGAAGAWIVIMIPRKKSFVISIPFIPEPGPTPEETALSTQELQQLLDVTRASVDQLAANGDFAAARANDATVARLQLILHRRDHPRKSWITWAS
ncbi:hypothetical protein ACFPT7_19735 [Acidicapsa dinghuensis]|uniref:Uncharacterized protein n=1 Tax=Acidicapsa dinghuensis TaxID=2218256 RepID=A0ABW1EKN9_9BACT|nr:hypothetical protein [Acidicapsa dinghuensis]